MGKPKRNYHVWTTEDQRLLRTLYNTITAAEIGARLGVTKQQVRDAAKRYGLSRKLVQPRRPFTPAEIEFIRAHYRQLTSAEIARCLGRTVPTVRTLGRKLGLSKPRRIKAPGFEAFLREKFAAGWCPAEIARAWGGTERQAVGKLCRRLGLVHDGPTQHYRDRVRAKTREQLQRAGLPNLCQLRLQVWRQRAQQLGWPEDLRRREFEVLEALWQNGPMTQRELAAVLGLEWRGCRTFFSNRPEKKSILAYLVARGLIVNLGRCVYNGGPRKNTSLYSIPLWGVEKGKFHGQTESAASMHRTGRVADGRVAPLAAHVAGGGRGGDLRG